METKKRKLRQRRIDPNASTVTLLDLDRNLSQACALAQSRPITVYRYRQPYAVIVSFDMWLGAAKIEDYVISDSPLVRVSEAIAPALKDRLLLLKRIGLRCRLSIDPVAIARALMLQALYSIPTEGGLRDQILSNMAFRWFVGLEVNTAVWHCSALAKDMRASVGDEDMVEVVLDLLQVATPTILQVDTDFKLNVALVRSWALRHPGLAKRVPIRNWKEIHLFLAPVQCA